MTDQSNEPDRLRERLTRLVQRILAFDGGPEANDGLIAEFARLAPHPEAAAFIFWEDLPIDEIVNRSMNYVPIALPTSDGYPTPPQAAPTPDPASGSQPDA